MPCAMARKIIPKAAEDLPLPLPVWTMIRPFSAVLVAMILSRAAFFLAIFSAWRASVSAVIGSSLGRSEGDGWAADLQGEAGLRFL